MWLFTFLAENDHNVNLYTLFIPLDPIFYTVKRTKHQVCTLFLLFLWLWCFFTLVLCPLLLSKKEGYDKDRFTALRIKKWQLGIWLMTSMVMRTLICQAQSQKAFLWSIFNRYFVSFSNLYCILYDIKTFRCFVKIFQKKFFNRLNIFCIL